MSNKELSELELKTLTSIGKNVKYTRRGLLHTKLVDLSKHTGVSRDVLCRLEALADGSGNMGNNRVYPSISTIIKFCEGVGVTPAEIFEKDFSSDLGIQERILDNCSELIKSDGIVLLDSDID